MYLSFYDLKEKPFQLNIDLRYFWLGESGKKAFVALKSGILRNEGIFVVTGDVGTGKTMFVHALTAWLRRHIRTVTIWDPDLGAADFFEIVSRQFQLYRKAGTCDALLAGLLAAMGQGVTKRRPALLVIEESQRIGNRLLGSIYELITRAKHSGIPLNVCFVGQNEFTDIVKEERHRRFMESGGFAYRIRPLTETESQTYIWYRLEKAEATETIFSPGAMREIHRQANGCPRAINILCDQALVNGYRARQRVIQREIIDRCREDLTCSGSRPLTIPAASERYSAGNPSFRKSGFTLKAVRAAFIVLVMALSGIFFLK